jgi:hypothetical protein
MDIAKLGVSIDPTAAVRGAKVASDAAKTMADRMQASGKTAETGAKAMGDSLQRESVKAKTAFERMQNAARTAVTGMTGAFSALANSMSGVGARMARTMQSVSQSTMAFKGLTTATKATTLGVVGLTVAIGSLLAGLGLLLAAAYAIGRAFRLIRESIDVASEFEGYQNMFSTLLGSFEKAKQRMEELKEFAKTTPYEIAQVVNASIILENPTKGAMSTGDNLRMIGDAAAKAQKPLDEVAGWVGRFYAALKGGAPVGEAAMRLFELQVITVETKQAIEAASNEGGKNFSALWEMVENDMLKAKGSMELMATSWKGIMSNIADGWTQAKEALGKPIMIALKPLMKEIADGTAGLIEPFGKVGEKIGEIISDMHAAVNVMQGASPDPSKWGSGFELAMTAAWDTIKQYASQIIDVLGALMSNRMKIAGEMLMESVNDMKEPAFWVGLKNTLIDVANTFIETISLGLIPLLNQLGSDFGKLGSGITSMDGGKIKSALFGGPGEPPLPVETRSFTRGGLENFTGPNPLLPDIEEAGTKLLTTAEAWENASREQTEAQRKFWEEQERQRAELSARVTPTDDMLPSEGRAESDALKALRAEIEAGKDKTSKKKAGKSDAEREMDRMKSEAERIIASNLTPQEEFDKAIANLDKLKAAGLLTADQYARAFASAAEDFQNSMDRMGQSQERMVNDAMGPLRRLVAEWGNVTQQTGQMAVHMADSLAGNMTNAFMSIIDGSAKASEAFDKMALAILMDINQMIVRMMVQLAISQALGWVTGGVGTVAAPVMHSGGEVGGPGPRRPVSPGAFANAPRFEFGGKVPGSGETPIVAEAGEHVLNRDQANDIKDRLGKQAAEPSGKGQSVTILNLQDRSEIDRYLMENPDTILNVLGRNKGKVKHLLGK